MGRQPSISPGIRHSGWGSGGELGVTAPSNRIRDSRVRVSCGGTVRVPEPHEVVADAEIPIPQEPPRLRPQPPQQHGRLGCDAADITSLHNPFRGHGVGIDGVPQGWILQQAEILVAWGLDMGWTKEDADIDDGDLWGGEGLRGRKDAVIPEA